MRALTSSLLAAAVVLGLGLPAARAAEEVHIPAQDWQHSGIFGTFDRAAAQRGLQVYREVCAACHGLELVAFRNLEALGYSEEEVQAIASEYTFMDGPNDEGEMFERTGIPADRFPSPFPNEQAARAANNGAYPPDLSLMAKARKGGEDYIYALLIGYEDPPPDVELMPGMYYNKYFPGHQIAMPPILNPDGVTYADGTPATVARQAKDVAVFLTWAAEPFLEERKQTGVKVILYLVVFSGLMYAVRRKVWSDVH